MRCRLITLVASLIVVAFILAGRLPAVQQAPTTRSQGVSEVQPAGPDPSRQDPSADPAAAADKSESTLTGTIVDHLGKPAAGAVVQLLSGENATAGFDNGRRPFPHERQVPRGAVIAD